MDVVIKNENRRIIDRLNIDIIKMIEGCYDVNDILKQLVNLYFNHLIIDITSFRNYSNTDNLKMLATKVDPSRVILLINNDPEVNSPSFLSDIIKIGYYNFTRNYEGINYLLKNPNKYDNVKHLIINGNEINKNDQLNNKDEDNITNDKRIIGIKNLSNHAGASSITAMMVRQLNNDGYSAVGIEMFRQDLLYYNDKNLIQCMNKIDLDSALTKHSGKTIIIDLNEFGEATRYCSEILCLIEPSFIGLTKMLKKNRHIMEENVDNLIVLNKSFVGETDISDFEYELKCKVFANIPSLNDRNTNLKEINELLIKLGLKKEEEN